MKNKEIQEIEENQWKPKKIKRGNNRKKGSKPVYRPSGSELPTCANGASCDNFLLFAERAHRSFLGQIRSGPAHLRRLPERELPPGLVWRFWKLPACFFFFSVVLIPSCSFFRFPLFYFFIFFCYYYCYFVTFLLFFIVIFSFKLYFYFFS